MNCCFASDLHGQTARYEKLWRAVETAPPDAVFIGGDLLPAGPGHGDFVREFLAQGFERLKRRLGSRYPEVLLILGNDDSRTDEATVLDIAASGLWRYIHDRHHALASYHVFGYACVPPTPFGRKDWERYDVSRHVPPGCVSPEEGWRSVPVPQSETRYATIEQDLETLTRDASFDRAVFLFHSPPDETALDRAANDGKAVDHVPLDLHVGSVAIRRFIERRQPLLTLHGHIHESVRLTGSWRDRIGRTHVFGAAHDGPELALVRFDPERLDEASRALL